MPKQYSSDFSLQNEIVFILNMHQGKDNPIPRWDLVRRVFGEDAVDMYGENDGNTFDRRVRDAIEYLRIFKGMHICNLGSGKGYFIAATREEYKQFKAYYLGPAYKKYQAVATMDSFADMKWGKEVKATPQGQSNMFGSAA